MSIIMAKKRSKDSPKKQSKEVATPTKQTFELSIETEEPIVSFDLGYEKIEGTVVLFHRLAMQAQTEAYRDRDEIEDYMPEYATLLNQHFKTKLKITPEMAYRIFDMVLNLFHQLKKS